MKMKLNFFGTTLEDVIVPELFNPYVINRTAEKSELIKCGIISQSPEFDKLASQNAATVNMPFFEDLTGESEQIIEGVDLEAAGIKSSTDAAVIFRRAKMWSATDLSGAMAGKDPMKAIAELVAGFWARDMQKELIAVLKGVFASESMKDNKHDISSLTGEKNKFTASSFIDAAQKLGDNQDILTTIAMHSATRAALMKQDQIEFAKPSENLMFDRYQGKNIIVDDSMPKESEVYTTYLFGAGAIALGNGNPVNHIATELDRDKKKGSGVNYLINRKVMILHPRGIKFIPANNMKTEGPSRQELADGTHWSRVYEPKQIRIVEFKHKL